MSRLLVSLAFVSGCASSVPDRPTMPVAAIEPAAEEGIVDPELALLEARLAEAEAENEALRAALASSHRERTECESEREDGGETDVLLGEGDLASMEGTAEGDDDSRPVLRLYGPPVTERPATRTDGVTALAGPDAPPVVVAAPPGSLGRLAVTGEVPAIPATPVVVVPRDDASGASAPTDPASVAYQEALRLVSERELDAALGAFSRFVAEHPDHAYADNALYWRAEVYYARHEFSAAIDELEALLRRYPSGSKVPDALLRLGMCWERLGDSERARTYFERVRIEHPDSTAAHMASREDA